MGKRKLCTGIIMGAVIGGLTTLIDKEAREYTVEKLATTKSCMNYYLKNPSIALQNIRGAVSQLNEQVADGTRSTMNALEQLENTLDKVVTKDEAKQIKLEK